jgi:hypothetical protein
LDGVGHRVADEIRHFTGVVDQARRRVVDGESVPAAHKVVSIFEPHTDVVIKEARKIEGGHKVCLNVGVSGLVIDCVVLDGNPNDATLVEQMLDRHRDILFHIPKEVAASPPETTSLSPKNGVLSTSVSPSARASRWATRFAAAASIAACATSGPAWRALSPS